MSPINVLASRRPRRLIKQITFDGAAGSGAVGTIAVATVTGAIRIENLTARCLTSLVGATATVEMGVAGNTAALIAQTTAEDIDDGEFWSDATPEAGVGTPVSAKQVEGNIIITVGTAAVTAGVLEIDMTFYPASPDGHAA